MHSFGKQSKVIDYSQKEGSSGALMETLAYGEHGLIEKRYSNMEQVINDWHRDGGSKPISLGGFKQAQLAEI